MRVAAGVLGGLLVLSACSSDEATAPDRPPRTTQPGTPLAALGPGTCLARLPDPAADRAAVVDCRRRHRAEVYAVVELEDGPLPGAGVLDRQAADRCARAYADYAGEPVDPTTDRSFAELVPSRAGWDEGERTVVCLALGSGGRSGRGSIADAPGGAQPS